MLILYILNVKKNLILCMPAHRASRMGATPEKGFEKKTCQNEDDQQKENHKEIVGKTQPVEPVWFNSEY